MYEKNQDLNIADDDILAEYRDRIIYLFAVGAVFFTMPFAVWYAYDGYLLLGAAVASMMVMVGANAISIYKKKGNLVPTGVILGIIVSVLGIVILTRGGFAFFWSYPVTLFAMFAFSRKNSAIYLTIIVGYLTTMLYQVVEFASFARGAMSLITTIFFCNIFLNVIHDLRQRLLKQSISDPLTGALNRRQLGASLSAAIERKKRACESVSLVSVDIDNFKTINDEFGHDVGDHVIKEVVEIIAGRTRKLDQLFRVGGEEFTLLMPLATGFDAKNVAKELCGKIASAKLIEGRKVTVSIGVSELEPETGALEWVKQADVALYEAKRTGRNRVVWWQQIADEVDESENHALSIPKIDVVSTVEN